jgi:RNA polymerase sigma factor (sigma-70 family)
MQISQIIAGINDTTPDRDGELALAAQKDQAVFQLIYDRWAVRIYQYFYFRTNDAASAEDMTSQLFLSVLQALPRYQHRGHFAAWLFAIARNLSKDYFRNNGREVPLEVVSGLISSSDPSEEIAHLNQIAQLRQLVQSLPEEEQELIRLRYVAELPFGDMAIVLNKREDAVKKSLYRLQDRLQSLLELKND